MVSLYGLFADPATIAKHLNELSAVLPEGATQIIGQELNRLISQSNGKLGFAFLLGLAIAIWSASSGMKAIIDALNIVYAERVKRGYLKLTMQSLALTAGAIVLMLLAIAAVIVLPLAFDFLGVGEEMKWLASREKAQWRWVSWGSTFAALTSLLLSWYASNLASYNETYGSLGTVVGFTTWIWISAMVVLVGAESDAEAEHQTMVDSTTGAPQPMGARGAKMASIEH